MSIKQQDTPGVPKVKICGITSLKEADWLNALGADYAGFVFYEKSKRNVSLMDAMVIKKCLNPSVKTVAVTVSPTVRQLRAIEIAGFDILQVHKELSLEVLRECQLPIWRALNIGAFSDVLKPEADSVQTEGELVCVDQAKAGEMENGQAERRRLEQERIEAYVLDGVEFGSGKTFDWNSGSVAQIRALFGDKKLVLAGGLTPSNVAEGIEIFRPDIVDVSSGVEKESGRGKDNEKIDQFIRKVREKNE